MYFVYAFIDMPMATTPRFIVNRFFDFVEPFFCARIHGALVDAGEESFNGFVFVFHLFAKGFPRAAVR